MLPSFGYVRPRSVGEAVRALAAPGARAHAGGTDLLGCLRDGVLDASTLVSLSGLGELRGVAATRDGGLRIGALTALAEVARHPEVAARYPVLAQAAAAVGSPQLRNQGTLGGNLCQKPRCWYFRGDFACLRKGGDTCYAATGENQFHAIFGGSGCYSVHPSDTAPALVALDASAALVGPKGRRTVPLAKFFMLPVDDHTRETVLEAGELLTEVLLPPAPPRARGTYRKVRARGVWDFALAGVAVWLTTRSGRVEQARLVLSGVAPVPWRVPEAEKALLGRKLDLEAAAAAAALAAAGAEPLGENGYKVALVRGVVEEALAGLA